MEWKQEPLEIIPSILLWQMDCSQNRLSGMSHTQCKTENLQLKLGIKTRTGHSVSSTICGTLDFSPLFQLVLAGIQKFPSLVTPWALGVTFAGPAEFMGAGEAVRAPEVSGYFWLQQTKINLSCHLSREISPLSHGHQEFLTRKYLLLEEKGRK